MSSNTAYNDRSMNNVISIYSNDITVDTINANTINVNDETINNSLTVNNVTLSPEEIAQLTGVSVQETIQQQLDNITSDLSNVVDDFSNQDIGGTKNFTDTLKITGQMNVNNTNISAVELSYSQGLIGNIQQQIDAVDTSGYMDLVSEQTATALKNFSASIQCPSIYNEQNTGVLNGYFIDSSNLIYTSKSGTFNVGTSVISGIDCVNKTLTALTTSPNTASISPDTTTRKAAIYTYQGYITSSNQVYTFTTTGIQPNQGIQFTNISDFIGSISGNLITLLNTTTLTPSSITLETSIVQIGSSFYFNTQDNYSLQRFVENANIIPPTRINSEPYTNLYSLLYPAGAPTSTFNRQITGFNLNNRIYSSDTATKLDMYILDNLTTTGANDTPYGSKLNVEIAGTDSTIYEYSLPPTNQTSQGNLSGFYDGGLFIFDTTLLSSPSTKAVLSNGTDYQAFTSSIDADNEVQLSYSRLQTTASTTLKSYVKDLTGTPFILTPSNQTGKYVNHDTISLIGASLGGFSYSITSPNTIVPDLGATFLNVTNYSPNSTTLIFRNGFSQLNTNDWYELSAAYGFYITAEPQNNYVFTTTTNNDDISPTTDITGCIIVNYLGGGLTFLFGTSSVSNSSLSNTTYAPINNVCYTSNTTSFNNSMTKARTFNNQFNPLNYQQPINGGTPLQFITYSNNYYLAIFTPSSYQIDDIFEYQDSTLNTNNVSQTGKTIVSITTTVPTALSGFNINDSAQNSSFYLYEPGNQNLFQYYAGGKFFVAVASIFTGLQPQIGDFIRFRDYNSTFSITFITNVVYVSGTTPYYQLYTPFINGGWTEYRVEGYFFRPSANFVDVYRPQTFKRYTTRSSITLFNQQKKYYTPELYNVFNQQTTNLFDTITTTNQFINEPLYFYSNNAYNALTSVEISLPATAIPDEFTVNTFSQTLSNKTFSNDTLFLEDIDVVDVRASGNIGCVDVNATGNIDCVDISCVDLTGSGLLTMTDLSKEHNISNVFIGRLISETSNNYGLAVGSSQTTLNNFVITRNVANNYTVINTPTGGEVWTTINNQQRLRVSNTDLEFIPSGNSRFLVNNGSTTLYRNGSALVECFCNNTNCYIDFKTSNVSDYACRINVNYSGSTNGAGNFDVTSNGVYFRNNAGVLRAYITNSLHITTAGISYDGTTIIGGTNNQIGFRWNGSQVGVAVDNVIGGYFITLSDRRVKKNIVDYEDGLTNIMKLKVKQYNFIKFDVANCDFTGNNCIIRDFSGNTIKYDCKGNCCDDTEIYPEKHTGMILDEVREIFPSLCSGGDNNSIGTIDYAGFVPHILRALQQQQEEINLLKEKLSHLNI